MANGNFAGGDGTENNPYLIEDAFDLDAIRNDFGAYYKLVNDINLDVAPFNAGEGWEPIGNNVKRFRGFFDGGGYLIQGLFIDKKNQSYIGLFGATEKGEIKNVGLAQVGVRGDGEVGGLIGHSSDTKVSDTFSRGHVEGQSNYVGGLIGYNFSADSLIRNSSFIGIVSGARDRVGGLTGQNRYAKIENCYSIANVTGKKHVGVLTGWNVDSARILNSFSSKLSVGDGVEVLVGENRGSTIKNSEHISLAQMESPETFINVGWHNELNEQGDLVWILEEGQYPRLWFEKPPYKTFILSNNSAYTFNTDEGTWEDKGEIPTGEDKAQFFEDHGMDNISKDALKLITSQIPGGKGKIVGMEMD